MEEARGDPFLYRLEYIARALNRGCLPASLLIYLFNIAFADCEPVLQLSQQAFGNFLLLCALGPIRRWISHRLGKKEGTSDVREREIRRELRAWVVVPVWVCMAVWLLLPKLIVAVRII